MEKSSTINVYDARTNGRVASFTDYEKLHLMSSGTGLFSGTDSAPQIVITRFLGETVGIFSTTYFYAIKSDK